MAAQRGIDWASLRDAYGDATAVPGLLARLWSSDAADREDAIGQLWSRICHQETVYSASAAAIPALVEAAQGDVLTPLQRLQVLALVVYIGRGEDTCWEGYASRDEMEACRAAVAAVVPELVRWAQGEDPVAQAVALQLGAYHPSEFMAAGVDPARLLPDATDQAVAAGASLARTIITGQQVGASTVRAAAELDGEALDYLDALEDLPVERQARMMTVELLERLRP